MQGGADADRGVLLPGDVGEAPHRSASRSAASPSGSGHCEKAPAEKETPTFSMNACRGSVETVTGMPCGVLLGERLQRVAPPGRHARVVERVDVEVVEVLLEHDGARRRLADGARLLEHRAVRAGLDDGLEHQADLLLEGEPAEQVLDPLLDGQARVLVGVHPAVAVEVAVGDAVLGGGELGAHGWCLSSVRGSWPPTVRSGGHEVWGGSGDRAGAELLDADDRAQGAARRPWC